MVCTSPQGNSISASRSTIKSQVSTSDKSSSRVAAAETSNDDKGIDTEYSVIEIKPLNDAIGSSHHTANSTSQSSLGESSLSSFLSVLFEDDEMCNREIFIVPDNPKPEQRSIRDMHQSFALSALENERLNCRWGTSDGHYLMPLSRRRSGLLQRRSSSFSGMISNYKPSLRTSNSFSSGQNNGAASMVLRKPERKRSPTVDGVSQKKSILDRFSTVTVSDSMLMNLALPRRSGNKPPPRRAAQSSRLTRAGDHEASTGNASWSNNDLLERKRRTSNLFLDLMMEPDGYAADSTAPPMTQSLSSLETDEELSSSFASVKAGHDEKKRSSGTPKQPSRNTISPRTATRRMPFGIEEND